MKTLEVTQYTAPFGNLLLMADGPELVGREVMGVDDDRSCPERAAERRGAEASRLPEAVGVVQLVHAFEQGLRRIEHRRRPRLETNDGRRPCGLHVGWRRFRRPTVR